MTAHPIDPNKPKAPDPASTPAFLRDPAKYAFDALELMAKLSFRGQAAGLSAALRMTNVKKEAPVDAADFARAFGDFAKGWAKNPAPLFELGTRWTGEYLNLVSRFMDRARGDEVEPFASPASNDRRFKAKEWSDWMAYDLVKQVYLVASRHLQELVAAAPGMNPQTREKVDFFMRQYINAIAPTNFAVTNPEVVNEAIATGGLSLLRGLGNLLEDLGRGDGIVKHRAPQTFELGVNVAATPGFVVYENALMQLIQYNPSTDKVCLRPVLFVPPIVNKFYHFDLSPETSFLKWLVDQGHTVFVISWVNPDARHAHMGFSHYLEHGPLAALKAIEAATGERQINMVSFCIGGTLTAATLAYLAETGEADRVVSATLIATMLDFSEKGDFSVFVGQEHIDSMRKYLSSRGYVESNDLTRLFSIVRSNDQIWSPAVRHYLMGKDSPASDLLFWFFDGARIPEEMLNQFNEDFVYGNKLWKRGGVSVNGIPLDLKKVTTPVYIVSMKDDHVAEWRGTYRGTQFFGGSTHFLLGGSGHNAGTLSAPSAGKHGHWVNAQTPSSAEEWLAGAQKRDGSWWPYWGEWLKQASGGTVVPAREVGAGGLKRLEPAPGSYVRVRS